MYLAVVTAKRKVIATFRTTGVYACQNANNKLNDVVRRNLHGAGCHVITVEGAREPRVGAQIQL